MLSTATIEETDTGLPATYGFHIIGKVSRNDMEEMGDRMLEAFDAHPEVDMLLVFRTDRTSETGASLSAAAMKAQVRSLTNVRNYVVANAPGAADSIIEAVGSIIPVEARTFETEAEALDWLRTQPRLAG